MADFLTRMFSRLQGEILADTLEAYRRASSSVHELLHKSDDLREHAALSGLTAWTIGKHQQIEMLCSWNAFVLQILGNEFLDSDYRTDPATHGYVPPITADQVMRFYSQVEGWLNRSHQAASNPAFRLDVQVPALLPPWSEVEPCPNSHLHGMLFAMCSIRDHCLAGIQFLGSEPPADKKQEEQFHQIQQHYASAMARARYAEDLHGVNPSQETHERVEPYVKEAIETFFLVGQLTAMPSLTINQTKPVSPVVIKPLPKSSLPGRPDFDPWCLTDPEMVLAWQRDPEAHEAILTMWQFDPNPHKTLTIHQEINAAFKRGDIQYARTSSGERLGHFFCCPWGPIYEVVRPVTIDGLYMTTLQQFVFDVTAEGMNLGESFTREIMVGSFERTNRTEYGSPDEEQDH